jgi:2-iminobutanoate/2-iminopropanoate deaminase
MSTSRVISTPNAPAAIGPYSQAIHVAAPGAMTFISGQIPLDPATGQLVGEGDVSAQTRQVMKNLFAIIEASGHQPADIVRCTIFLKDLNDFATVNFIYSELLQGHHPSRATVEVARLPRDVRVEIDAICVASAT